MRIERVPSGMLMANCYVVMDEENKKAFIVDPGGFSEKVVKHLDESGCELEYIILTHGHGDHSDGVPTYQKKYPEAKLVASELEKDFMLNTGANFARVPLEADKYVADMETMKVGDMELVFISTPGHTPGGMCIYAPQEKVLFSGDTLFMGSVGRTDFPGGSFKNLMSNIKGKLFALDDDVVVLPGHDRQTTIGNEKRFNPFV